MTKVTCGRYTCKFNSDPNSFICQSPEIILEANDTYCVTYEEKQITSSTTKGEGQK